jgi:hypothetical protein
MAFGLWFGNERAASENCRVVFPPVFGSKVTGAARSQLQIHNGKPDTSPLPLKRLWSAPLIVAKSRVTLGNVARNHVERLLVH